jgi:CRISPR-associated protein Csx17
VAFLSFPEKRGEEEVMSERPPLYAGTLSEVRLAQVRETYALSVRERLELLDQLNRDGEKITGIARDRSRRRPQRRRHLPERTGWQVLELDGCAPVPLAGYLKALGVLRILGEQFGGDGSEEERTGTEIRGWWERERFLLWSPLSREALLKFLLEAYRPTPILAPWNGGSGFYKKDMRDAIEAIESSNASRFAQYAAAIDRSRRTLTSLGLDVRPVGEPKEALLRQLRSTCSDEQLTWIDAAIVLSGDGLRYPPLLGTGGNDGRLEFTNNFMQRLVEVFDSRSGRAAAGAGALLSEALFEDAVPGLQSTAIGQFSPGAAGGPNATSGFSGDGRVNPWDYILMLEGALLFGARVARRLEGNTFGHLSFPFTVRAVGAGSGATDTGDEGDARAETWVPLWSQPSGIVEVSALLGEGRVSVGRRTAGDGLDFVRAVARLGSDRGIDSFQRYGFLMRSGRAYLATPLGRIKVRRNPQVDLIDELDQEQWLTRFRRFSRGKERPARIVSLARRLDDALFDLAEGRTRPIPPAQAVLVLLGEIQDYLAASVQSRDALQPVPVLSHDWFHAGRDASGEFELAAALGGLHAREVRPETHDRFQMPLVENLWPVRRRRERGRPRHRWNELGRNRAVWGPGGIDANLAAVLHRRLLDAHGEGVDSLPLESVRSVRLPVLAAWLADELNERRILTLTRALALVELPAPEAGTSLSRPPTPAAFGALKPLFTPARQLRRISFLESDAELPRPGRVARLLAADRVKDALDEGIRALRVRRVVPADVRISVAGISGHRLLSGLIAPMRDRDLRVLLEPFTTKEARPAEANTEPSSSRQEIAS